MDAGSVKFSDRVLKTRIDCEIFTTPVIGLSVALVNPESHLLDKCNPNPNATLTPTSTGD